MSCIVSEIKRDIGRKSQFLYPRRRNNLLGKTAANIFALFFTTESDPWPASCVDRFCKKSFYSQLKRGTDGQTDRQTNRQTENDLSSGAWPTTYNAR